MRALKTVGYKVMAKFRNFPQLRTNSDFNTEKQAKEMAEFLSEMPNLEEVSVSVNIEELTMSIESDNPLEPERGQAGFHAPKRNT